MKNIYFITYANGSQRVWSQTFFTPFNIIKKLNKILFMQFKSTKLSLLEMNIQENKLIYLSINFKIAIINILIANTEILGQPKKFLWFLM